MKGGSMPGHQSLLILVPEQKQHSSCLTIMIQ